MRRWIFLACALAAAGCGGSSHDADGGSDDGGVTGQDGGPIVEDGGTGDAGLPPECVEDMCGTCDLDPSNDCVQDCAGDWGGSATADMCGTCDTDPSNDCVADCAGEFGGSAVPDMCGTCDSDSTNDCVEDCAGEWGGSATTDACGTCDADASNDCDCAGTAGGSATTDMCGTCDADPSNDCVQDCAGDWGGTATLDGCGTCDTDPTNDCPNDCAGTPGGPAVRDMCGTCDTDSTNDCVQDCAGAWGGSATTDMCGTCDADPTNDCAQDCAGDWGGSATTDMCGTCDTDPTNDCVQDCAGDWGGTAVLDLCGRCTGSDTGLTPCPTVTLTPVADSYVSESSASANYGTQETFDIVAENLADTKRVFLRFDLSSLPTGAVVRGARLEAHAYSGYAHGGDGNVYASFVSDDTWSETGITWANQPAADDAHLGHWWLWYNYTPRDQLGTISTPELAAAVQTENDGDGVISLRLSSPGYDTRYRSREYGTASQRPALVVGYLPSSTTTLEPVADSYVSGSANHGTEEHLYVDPSGSQRVYLRFDVSSLPAGAEIVEATLTMTAYEGFAYGGDGNVYTSFVSDDTWSETAINSTNAPAADSAHLGHWWLWYNYTARDQVGTMSTPELRDAVQTEADGDNAISLQLSSPGYRTHYRSREYATRDQRPVLTVRYVTP